jgi:hypothetical protein
MDTQIKKSTPRDVFLHLLAIITLYVSAGSFLNLVFKLINTAFPDQLGYTFDFGTSIRYSMAALIVVFPVFVWLSMLLERDQRTDPEKASLRVRRWLISFTLFAAGALLIGDLVALVFNLLEGDLTMRFVLKVLSILVVAGIIFGYYLWALRKKPGSFPQHMKMGIGGVMLVVLAGIVAGFMVAGSPVRARLEKIDAERIGHLQNIQSQIVFFWQQKNRLPKTLDELRDPISGFVAPVDPETKTEYEYATKEALSFELCATFNLPAKSEYSRYAPEPVGAKGIPETWAHDAGRVCFDRVIDPDLYRKPAF